MKKENRNALLKFLGLVFLFIVILFIGRNTTKEHASYYNDVNLKLTGIVKEKRPLTTYGHDFGVIAVDIDTSNIAFYDERENLEKHLGVIKDKKADLVFSAISRIKIGDSLIIHTQNYEIYRNDELIKEGVIDLPRNNFIFRPFNEVNKNIKL